MLQEMTHSITSQTAESGLPGLLVTGIHWLQLGAETFSVVIVGVGMAVSAYYLVGMPVSTKRTSFRQVRITLSHYLALGLEFQLAADIIGTVVAPSWEHLGKVGAIAVIRTFLNYFLAREIKEEGEITEDTTVVRASAQG